MATLMQIKSTQNKYEIEEVTEYEFSQLSEMRLIRLLENFKYLEANKKKKIRKKYDHFRRRFDRHVKEGDDVLALGELDSYYNPTKIYKNPASKRPAHFSKKKTDDKPMLY